MAAKLLWNGLFLAFLLENENKNQTKITDFFGLN